MVNTKTWGIVKFIMDAVPILKWLPRYSLTDASSDLIAGVTVGLTLIPQAIAYAALAGLSPQFGLYSSFAGSLVYIFFGTIKEVNIGPTAILSLLTHTYTHGTNPDFVVLLCFLSGWIELLCGLLHLGFLVEFVSVPVTAGFSSAAAVIIASSQVKNLLGVSTHGEDFIEVWEGIVEHLSETRTWDLCLSAVCCATLFSLRHLKNINLMDMKSSLPYPVVLLCDKCLWVISTGRNVIIVVISAAVTYYFTTVGQEPFILTGKIVSGLPNATVPPFTSVVGNKTYSFIDMCSHLGKGLVIVPLISLLGNIAIAKAFANGEVVNATQEMITLGICNIVGSFFGSMPVSGSFSRSAVSNASGIRTPLGGLYTSILVILSLSLLTPYFYFIPKATLASVIVCAVIFMVEIKLIGHIWKTNKKDLIPGLTTFIACLVQGVEIGILVGIVIDLLYLLLKTARPACAVTHISDSATGDYILISPESGILFSSIDHVRLNIMKVAQSEEPGKTLPIVVDFQHVSHIDYTAVQGLRAVAQEMDKKKRMMIFHRMKAGISEALSASTTQSLLKSTNDSQLKLLLICSKHAECDLDLQDLKVDDVNSISRTTKL